MRLWTRQLDGRGVVVRWVKHRGRAAAHGYKAHIASDADGGIVRSLEITPANVSDGRMLGAVPP